jgi:hypothetical protein
MRDFQLLPLLRIQIAFEQELALGAIGGFRRVLGQLRLPLVAGSLGNVDEVRSAPRRPRPSMAA